jgi:hypothetical protein
MRLSVPQNVPGQLACVLASFDDNFAIPRNQHHFSETFVPSTSKREAVNLQLSR